VSIAQDAQGEELAKPWLERAKVSFPALIDRHNEIGKLYGVKYVPVGILLDADGMLARPVGTVDVGDIALREELAQWVNTGSVPQWQQPRDGGVKGVQLTAREQEADQHLQKAISHLDRGERDAALAELQQGTALDPDNWLIRKQGWAVENPQAFYEGEVDYRWQKAQIESEEGEGNS
jgi:hypothetical protein